MKYLIPALLLGLAVFPQFARAQEIVQDPVCFTLVNEAPFKVYGSFVTDYYTTPDGTKARHRSNFRLDEPGSTDPKEGYPLDKAEFCSYGPFYPDRKLELVLRTLVPVFSCKTRVDQGPVVITGNRKPEGGVVMQAKCFE